MNAQINQCDGCRRKLPVIDGIHRGPEGYDLIGCTADRYGLGDYKQMWSRTPDYELAPHEREFEPPRDDY